MCYNAGRLGRLRVHNERRPHGYNTEHSWYCENQDTLYTNTLLHDTVLMLYIKGIQASCSTSKPLTAAAKRSMWTSKVCQTRRAFVCVSLCCCAGCAGAHRGIEPVAVQPAVEPAPQQWRPPDPTVWQARPAAAAAAARPGPSWDCG
jgi:hypothetical protein